MKRFLNFISFVLAASTLTNAQLNATEDLIISLTTQPLGSDQNSFKFLVNADTIGLCAAGNVTHKVKALPFLGGQDITEGGGDKCLPYAVGTTFTILHNASGYLNMVDSTGVPHAAGLFPGDEFTDTGLIPNNEQWVTCSKDLGLAVFDVDDTGYVLTNNTNSSLVGESCDLAGVIGTDSGDGLFKLNAGGTGIKFQIKEDRDDAATVYLDDGEIVFSEQVLSNSVYAAYANYVVAIVGTELHLLSRASGSWTNTSVVTPSNIEKMSVARNDGTTFVYTGSEFLAYRIDQDQFVFAGNFTVENSVALVSATSIGELYYVDTSGSAHGVTLTVITPEPTASPTRTPTVSPTLSPSGSPTVSPTDSPTGTPTVSPTGAPSATPTDAPTGSPTTATPTTSPTTTPPTPAPTKQEDGSFMTIIWASLGGSLGLALIGYIVYVMWFRENVAGTNSSVRFRRIDF